MALGDLFKSKEEIAKEKRREQRAKERQVERVIESHRDRVAELKKQQAAAWEQARTLLQQGNQEAAKRMMLQYKALGQKVVRFENQAAWTENQLTNILGAADTKKVGEALTSLVAKLELDPDTFAQDLETVADTGADIADMNKTFDKAFQKDQEKTLAEAAVEGPDLENDPMWQALEEEAAVGVTGVRQAVEGAPNAAGDNNNGLADINAGLDRLKSLLKE